jgi:4-amino-4-deoxy-L-arabinose transferase-like glycosyltransferase
MTEPRSKHAAWIAVILIIVVAATVRFIGLGDLGFFGDEETTAFAARSLAEGHGAAMPSGMPYRRALPITWLSAVVARGLGVETELAYRVVPALLGTIAIPLIFLAGRQFAGTGTGIIAALLMALSGWHVLWSRTARMYAPLVTALIAFFYLILKWKETGRSRYLVGAALMYLTGVLIHRAGVAVVLFPILLATMRNGDDVVSSRDATVVALLLGTVGLLVGDLFIARPYAAWSNVPLAPSMSGIPDPAGIDILLWILGIAGGFAGVLWSKRTNAELPAGTRPTLRLALAITATLTFAAAFSGNLWAVVTLAISWLVMVRAIPTERRVLPPWSIIGVIAVGAVFGSAVRLAGHDWSLRSLAVTPFPYLPYLGTLLPTMILLFFVTAAGLIILRPRYGDHGLRASVVFVLIYALLVGFDVLWAPWRYLLPMYPWIVLSVSAGIWWAAEYAITRFTRLTAPVAIAALSLVIVAGGIGGHGIPAALGVMKVDYGERVPWYDQGLIGRPDHRGAGLYVRSVIEPGDIVIAEDPLQQKWYAGQADYWLRSFSDARRFLHRTEDGSLHDIYVWSKLMVDPPDASWLNRPDRSVWLITSLETAYRRDLHLEDDQSEWLSNIENSTDPVYMSRDGLTAVFCFGACRTHLSDPDQTSHTGAPTEPGS